MNKFNNNSVQLIGNLGQDVAILTFGSGNKKATFSLATTESFKNKEGDVIKNTQWHNVIAWGAQADQLAASVAKGYRIEVHGKIQNRSFQDKDGNKRYVTEIVMSHFKKLNEVKTAAEVEQVLPY
jgi:single-strand DNA-binding protein